MEKYVYSFTNMRPKLKVGHYAEVNWLAVGIRDGVNHYLDFSASYDRDSKWGGDIDSLFVLGKATDYISKTGDVEGGTWYYEIKINDPFGGGVHVDKYLLCAGLPDEDDTSTPYDDWYTDLWIWVKDNEGLTSDTIHISIGHVENSVARQEYEGK
jgi:hypothetical protein